MNNHIVALIIYITILTKISVDSTSPSPEIREVIKKLLNMSRTNRNMNTSISLSSEKPRLSVKKWQVGRVSRKHYEIVNMLWRKTKLFMDNEVSSSTICDSRLAKAKPTRSKTAPITAYRQFQTPSSTPSYIEFYYLDDNDDRLKQRDAFITNINSKEEQLKYPTSDNIVNIKREQYPMLSFNVNNPEFQFVTRPSQINNLNSRQKQQMRTKVFYDKQSMYDFIRNKLKSKNIIIPKINSTLGNIEKTTSLKNAYASETCPVTFDIIHENFTTSLPSSNLTLVDMSSSSTELSDKIKFFEMYDQHTQSTEGKINLNILDGDPEEYMAKENYIDSKQVLLEDVNKEIGHHDGLNLKHRKKHVHDDIKDDKTIKNDTDKVRPIAKYQTNVKNNQKPTSKLNIFTADQDNVYKYSLKEAKNASRPVSWSDYPFSAVYTYEPSQIHCDAGALSPHWLLASGACLSRYHSQDPTIEGRSAFVSYCGDNWWQPERIIYVKYIVVHPRFHPKDETRRYLYNIGLIQVAGSMASSCFSWRPLSIMSHHFAANSEGTLVSAVGWGLDRYDVRYFRTRVPTVPLHVYKALVYSSSCPGNTGYSEMKLRNGRDATKNIYCLLLPPYNGEDSDPVHGSMLLVGGKLVALYIQEERRSWGEQSAQYTGVWRLVPWVYEVAREPENTDSFNLDV